MEQEKQPIRVVFIHGIRTRKSNRNMHKLAVAFRQAGFCVLVPSYGFFPALIIGLFAWIDCRIAKTMSGLILDGDILVGHSNGATLAYMISKYRKLRGAVLINAALETDKLPEADFVHVYFNRNDIVALLSAIIPFHPWGAMGGIGYEGKPIPQVLSIDQSNPQEKQLPSVKGHSDIFSRGKVRPWSRYMVQLVLDSLKGK